MFERYTEKARRVIFFARYEASVFGSRYIETEHLLLGLLREDKARAVRILKSVEAIEEIRKRTEEAKGGGQKISTSVDLPLTLESKRVLTYAAEEAERLKSATIDCVHLWLGLLRQETSFAAQILGSLGVTADLFEGAPEPSRRVEQQFPFEHLSTETYACLNEARLLAGSRAVEPGHLLLGAIVVRTAVALRLFGSPEAIQQLRAEVQFFLEGLPAPALPGTPGRLSARAWLLFSQAVAETEADASEQVQVKHLWLGLLAVDDQGWLKSRGVDGEDILGAF